MKVLEMSYREDNYSEFIRIIISDSFQKEAIRAISDILLEKCGKILDLKKTIISFRSFPKHFEDGVMCCEEFRITDPYNYSAQGILFWKSKKTADPIKFTNEVEKDELDFWIEPKNGLDIYELLVKNTKENMAYRNKFFIEGYPFIVTFEMVDINSNLKVFSNDKIDDNFKNSLENMLAKGVEKINEYNIENQVGGVIHSIGFTELKKNKYVKFSIDFGSSGEEGINNILKIIKESGLDISKVELKGA